VYLGAGSVTLTTRVATVTYRVEKSDLDSVASLVARAMARYPVFTYVIPDDASCSGGTSARLPREDKLRSVLRFILGIAALQGEIVAPSRGIEAVAVWVRSENMRLATTEILRAGFATLPLKIGLPATKRLLGVGRSKHRKRAQLLTGRYYLLDMLSVDPKQQNKGYGRLLLESKLQDIDRECARCYLETSDARNIEYYQRFGFELVHQYRIARVPVFCLLRPQSTPQILTDARGINLQDA